MNRYKRDYYSKDELLKRKLYFTFYCTCQYCNKAINIHLLCKTLFIHDIAQLLMHLNYYHDIFMYHQNITRISTYEKNIKELKLERNAYLTISSNISTMLTSYTEIKNNHYVKDFHGKTLYHVDNTIVDKTYAFLDDVQCKMHEHNNAMELVQKNITNLTSDNVDLYDIFSMHDSRIFLKNLTLYHIDSDIPEHIKLIQQYASHNRCRNLLKTHPLVPEHDWKLKLQRKCCDNCHLYGHYTKYCRNNKFINT